MKLFITNRNEFERDFPNSKEIHRQAFQDLQGALAGGNIPTILLPMYRPEGNVILDFVNKNQDIYYYTYTSVVS